MQFLLSKWHREVKIRKLGLKPLGDHFDLDNVSVQYLISVIFNLLNGSGLVNVRFSRVRTPGDHHGWSVTLFL